MKFTLMSDLHADFHGITFRKDQLEDHIIVAGDSGNNLGNSVKVIKSIQKHGQVFAVDGNHEHYANSGQGRTIAETEDRFYEMIGQTPNHVQDWGEVLVVGACGWYDPSDDYDRWTGYMNDGRFAGDPTEKCKLHASLIDTLLESANKPCIVVTHMAPCLETLSQNPHHVPWNGYYYNRYLPPIMYKHSDKIKVWVHGHTHFGADRMVGKVRVIANPRGYPRENPNWTPLTVTC